MGTSHQLRALSVLLIWTVLFGGCASETESSGSDWETDLNNAYDRALSKIDDDDELQAELSTLESAVDRDMVLYRLAFNHPARATTFCSYITTASFVEKCRQVLGRPHLGTVRRAKTNPSEPITTTP